jgi:hypothetical protein
MEVTMSEQERPGLERSRMYHRAGLTRARVSVSWSVDCQGSRRYEIVSINDSEPRDSRDLQWRMQSPQRQLRFEPHR